MARVIDEGKIERIREATIEFVVQNGYGGAAISSIARRAGVAEGYLYRFHRSKHELVTDLLYSKVAQIIEKLEILLNTCPGMKEVIFGLTGEFFKMATDTPEQIKFIHVLMHDYDFQISDDQRQQIKNLCEKVVQTGIANGEINKAITAEEAYGMVVIYPLEIINLRMKGFFGNSTWTTEDQNRIAEFSINALK